MSQSLTKQIADCEHYELAPLFLDLFREHQPVLEAGCGSGRWCAWLQRHGIRSDGVDWSEELCARATREISGSRFVACDMTHTPFADGSYGGILALGSIEHSVPGPEPALKEFFRLLKENGVAIITVPYGGFLRRLLRDLKRPAQLLKSVTFLRRLMGKRVGGVTLFEAHAGTTREWYPRFAFGDQGWYFLEYEFNKKQMRTFLQHAGFEIVSEWVGFHNEGILHYFGRLFGVWNQERSDVDFTLAGKILRKICPVSLCGHMLCYVVRKASRTQ